MGYGLILLLCTQDPLFNMSDPSEDCADGLPPDVLALIAKAGGVPSLKAMREVCKTWQNGFEMAVSGNLGPRKAMVLPEGAELAQRFPGLTSLDLGESFVGNGWLPNLHALPKLRVLVLGREVGGGFASRLTDAGLAHLRGLPINSLDLANCQKLTVEGLKCLQGLSLTKLNLQVSLLFCSEGKFGYSTCLSTFV